MASVGAGATGGAITPDTSEGVVVSDSNDRDRVILGHLGGGDYGLRVIAADGSTVIIDGTSDMFRIIASGTISQNWPGGAPPGATSTSVTLTALGTFSAELPAVQLALRPRDDFEDRYPGLYMDVNSGGFPGQVDTWARGWWDKTGSNFLRIRLDLHAPITSPGGGIVGSLKYYVMQQVAV